VIDLQRLNHRHQALLTWCISNPHRKLGDAAHELSYTRAYVSAVVHSDAFQAAYQQLCEEQGVQAVFVGASVRDKLQGLAHRSLDEISTRLEANVLESKEVLSAAKLSLTALGYINPKGYSVETNVQNNIQVDISIIDEARERALSGGRVPFRHLPHVAPGPIVPARMEEVPA